ncbi:MAG: hypothetical protein LBQ66_16895, partial [Planctomycetaceae bacterium]|nr:hypothetical protein [Planctomycetaceae bacterium]
MTIPKRQNKFIASRSLLAGLLSVCAILAFGCQNLPRSGIDQSGDRLFESCPLPNIFSDRCNLFGNKSNAAQVPTPIQGNSNLPSSSSAVPASTLSSPSSQPGVIIPNAGLPGNFGSSASGVSSLATYGSTATAVNPNMHGVNTAVVPRENAEGLHPSFEESGGYVVATGVIERPSLLVSPVEQIAPVGSEVVLIASYLGKKDRLVTNEKVEWNLEGVGSFLKYDKGSHCDLLVGDFVKASKISERYVITKTSRLYQTLTRGTPETRDDLHILQGQTWVSVNSLREGTTHVSAFAPSLSDWSRRTMFGLIHWVDAQWVVPVLPIAPVGESRVLTTTILRRTNGQPRQGWIVRYEILNGHPAGFGNTFAQIQEVVTDISGQASVILSQKEPKSGTNTISVQIIRPGSGVGGQDSVAAGDKRITVGYETLRQTWSGEANVRVNIKGPERGSIGSELPYEIIVTNNTDFNVEGVLALSMPPVANYVRSTPPIYMQSGQILYWNVEIPAKRSATVNVILRQNNAGRMILESNFTPGSRVNTQPNLPANTNNSVNTTRDQSGSIAPILPNINTPTTPNTNNTTGATTWQNSTTILGAPTNTPNSVYSDSRYEHLRLNITVDAETPLVVGEKFHIKLSLDNQSGVDLRNVVLQLPIPKELRNSEKYVFQGPQDVSYNNTMTLDTLFNIKQKFAVVEAKKTVTMLVGFPTLLPAGYVLTGELYI